jgi:hypothetical protein
MLALAKNSNRIARSSSSGDTYHGAGFIAEGTVATHGIPNFPQLPFPEVFPPRHPCGPTILQPAAPVQPQGRLAGCQGKTRPVEFFWEPLTGGAGALCLATAATGMCHSQRSYLNDRIEVVFSITIPTGTGGGRKRRGSSPPRAAPAAPAARPPAPARRASRRPAACADCARLARLGEPPVAPADVLA